MRNKAQVINMHHQAVVKGCFTRPMKANKAVAPRLYGLQLNEALA